MSAANDNEAASAVARTMDRIAISAFEDCLQIAGKLDAATLAELNRRFNDRGSVYGLAAEAVHAEIAFRKDGPDRSGGAA